MTPVELYPLPLELAKQRIAELERGNRELRKEKAAAEAQRDDLARQLEAVREERDAALSALNMKPHERNSHALGIAEGKRRGTAAAVKMMKDRYAMDGWAVITSLEAGDHLL